MNYNNYLIISVLSLGVALPFLMLFVSMFGHDEGGGPGPRCDVCGEYLSEHGMYDCETYC